MGKKHRNARASALSGSRVWRTYATSWSMSTAQVGDDAHSDSAKARSMSNWDTSHIMPPTFTSASLPTLSNLRHTHPHPAAQAVTYVSSALAVTKNLRMRSVHSVFISTVCSTVSTLSGQCINKHHLFDGERLLWTVSLPPLGHGSAPSTAHPRPEPRPHSSGDATARHYTVPQLAVLRYHGAPPRAHRCKGTNTHTTTSAHQKRKQRPPPCAHWTGESATPAHTHYNKRHAYLQSGPRHVQLYDEGWETKSPLYDQGWVAQPLLDDDSG